MKDFQSSLLNWYHQNKRDLPWRSDKNPYKIWLSEIILQQTRISQGLPYYLKFIDKFKDIFQLAEATEEEILKIWQGLGYYSRARNLHFTAKYIVSNFNGIFPDAFCDLKKMKGIGDYTASMIASVCFNQPFAVVDGNVERVVSRLNALSIAIDSTEGKKLVLQTANKYLDKNNPGDFNQAMMELGAMICTPENPKCSDCPVFKFCKAYKLSNAEFFPIKLQKKQVSVRHFNYFIVKNNGKIAVKKRENQDIWKNLYDFPLLESEFPESVITDMVFQKLNLIDTKKHQLTHRLINIKFFLVTSEIFPKLLELLENNKITWVSEKKIRELPVPKPIEKILSSGIFH